MLPSLYYIPDNKTKWLSYSRSVVFTVMHSRFRELLEIINLMFVRGLVSGELNEGRQIVK